MKLFRRKPEQDFWFFPKAAPLPPCPFDCGKRVLHDVIIGGEKRDIPLPPRVPCEHQEEAIRRAEFDATHQAVFNPKTNDFDIYPRRA
jgi:hypothetical protein